MYNTKGEEAFTVTVCMLYVQYKEVQGVLSEYT